MGSGHFWASGRVNLYRWYESTEKLPLKDRSRLILVKLELGFTYSIAWCLRKENYCKPGYRLYRNRLVAEKYYFEVDRNEISEKRIRDAKIHSIGISARAPESPLYNQDLEKNCPRLTIDRSRSSSRYRRGLLPRNCAYSRDSHGVVETFSDSRTIINIRTRRNESETDTKRVAWHGLIMGNG